MSEMNGIRGKIKGAFDLNDEQVERLLQGHTSVDPMLASLLAQLRTLAKPPSTELAESHIQMLVEAARDTSSSVGLDENPGLLRRRLGTRAAAIAFALLLLGAGVAAAATGTLPAPAQKVIADLVSQVGIEIPGADQETGDVVDTADVDVQGVSENAHQFVDAVQQAVRDYTEALETWVACVVENSAPACPDKPVLNMPHPSDFGLGRPDHAGQPEDKGRPDDTGPPDNAGKPEETGPPDDRDPPGHTGKPDEPGPPDHAGQPEDKGRPDDAGTTNNKSKGPPTDDDE